MFNCQGILIKYISSSLCIASEISVSGVSSLLLDHFLTRSWNTLNQLPDVSSRNCAPLFLKSLEHCINCLGWSITISHPTSKNVPEVFNGNKIWTFGRPGQHFYVVLIQKIPADVRRVGSSIIMLKLKIYAHSTAERKNNRLQHFVSVTDTCHPTIQSNKVGSMVVGYATPYHHRSTPIGIMLFDGTLMITFTKASPNADPTICEVKI